ncbi:MAG: LPP20 family lipoprotein [Fidelibacterota bacterium]|nr:MAG: LPP20 family lipoprotein [Candidatus Neomarinimicrobiota bacterium]
MLRLKLVAAVVLLTLCTSIAWSQWSATPGAVTEQNEFGLVDYSQRVITATGIGAVPANAPNVGAARANAIRAAKMDALRNLVEAVKAVRVSSETTVNNSMVENDVIRTKVDAMVRGAQQVGEVKYLSDASVELTMAVPMSGIMDVVLPVAAPAVPPTSGEVIAPGTESTQVGATPAVAPEVAGQPITGLIIDTRGLAVKPSMSPRILSQDGTVLYGPGKYPRDFAVTQGVVGYHKDIEAAKRDARVAGNPLTVKGTGTTGTLGTDVMIATNDAQLAAGYTGFSEAISNCRVMFILD